MSLIAGYIHISIICTLWWCYWVLSSALLKWFWHWFFSSFNSFFLYFFWTSMKLSNNNYICQSPGFCSFPYGKQQALSSLSTLISSICFCALTSVDSCSSRISFCPTSITKENCLPVSYFPASVPVKISSHNYFLFVQFSKSVSLHILQKGAQLIFFWRSLFSWLKLFIRNGDSRMGQNNQIFQMSVCA